MESVSTPRISANMLDSHVGQNVIIVGKVMQLRGESALLDANGQVNAILNLESHLMAGNGAQIIGRVNPDLSVKVYNALDLGSNVDFQVAQSVVEITQQYKDLFTPPPPASAASYYSSSSEVYSSSSSVDVTFSQLARQPNISPSLHPVTTRGMQSSRLNDQSTSPYRPTTAESRRSSSSEIFSSVSSINNELPQLVIEHDRPSPSELATAQSWHSSSSEVFGSTSSLDDELSALALNHDQPSTSQTATTGSGQSWQLNASTTLSPRPTTRTSYYSSSSEDLGSISELLDNVFSQPAIEEETPVSSQLTIKDTQSSQPICKSRESSGYSYSSTSSDSVRELAAISPVYGSPSSTGKLSWPSPIQTPMRSISSSPGEARSPQLPQSPRLYRTRSGSLANLAELRQRREREDELLDMVLSGIKVLEEAQVSSSQRSVTMSVDDSGRWRIHSIQEPWGP
ncbi:replication factor A protein 3-domain-containing protein [Xylaria sp. FL1777]|nr:replication factor A protein 3-domain-containing protein [Xylaria sp. FL1777]